ncbi:MAG: iron-containing alcohol dehydrogenase [Verrucomicrobiota bacterium]
MKEMMDGFESKRAPKIFFGAGVVARLGEVVSSLGASKALLVTDPGVAAAGHADRALSFLKKHGVEVCYFDQAEENPTEGSLIKCLDFIKSYGEVDLIIGFGGGSSMDTAKGANFILTNGGTISDYVGYGKARKPMLPFVAVPTTAGTGSECQAYALIADEKTHVKRALGDPKAMAQVALLDPELVMTAPASVIKATGMDALAHAIESLVCKRANRFSRLYSREAFHLLSSHFERVLAEPGDIEASGSMLLGASYAGLAIENSMLGCAHSCANPFTAHYKIVHGVTVGLMLPEVMRLNQEIENVKHMYDSLELGSKDDSVIDYIERMLHELGFHEMVSEISVTKDRVEAMAEMASKQWTAQFNPRDFEQKDFVKVYENAIRMDAYSSCEK